MEYYCTNCSGFVGEEDKVYLYFGKRCKCTNRQAPEPPTIDNQLAFELRQGKFGMYFYDKQNEKDLTLQEVLELLNEHNPQI